MSARIADYGVRVGRLKPGELDKITDVPGVTVGHATIADARHRTGVTVILPCEDNVFLRKMTAAGFVLNGFGKTQGLVQVGELGTLETPIALTNTLNVGLVSDALASYTVRRCERDGAQALSVNPVVGECNDARLNAIADRPVREKHVLAAIQSASRDFAEGCVGAGAGTVCHGLKGGIGSASRLLPLGGKTYTLGVLVQSNHGTLEELTVRGRRVGEEILRARRKRAGEPPCDQGSIMIVLATDLPLDSRQLGRVLRRCTAGLARCGSYFGHGSGDVMIGFTTENRVPHNATEAVLTRRVLAEPLLELPFRAAADATEEAVLNSLVAAQETVAPDGTVYESLAKYL